MIHVGCEERELRVVVLWRPDSDRAVPAVWRADTAAIDRLGESLLALRQDPRFRGSSFSAGLGQDGLLTAAWNRSDATVDLLWSAHAGEFLEVGSFDVRYDPELVAVALLTRPRTGAHPVLTADTVLRGPPAPMDGRGAMLADAAARREQTSRRRRSLEAFLRAWEPIRSLLSPP